MKVNREVIAIALPAIVSNITTPLLGLVDTAIVGHIGSATGIAAIAVGSSITNMIYWLLNFLRMGSSGLTAQALGAGRRGEAVAVLWRGLCVGVAAALALWCAAPWVCRGVLDFMGAEPDTEVLASRYFFIAVAGAPAVLGMYALSGWFLGMQDSRAVMWMALVTNISNIAISLALVLAAGMGIEGVALGTASAQYIGIASGLIMARHRFHPRWPGWRAVGDGVQLRRFFSINVDIFVRTAALVAVTLWFTRAGAEQGTLTLAANALLMQLFLFFSYFMDGFAFSGEALAGCYAGAADAAGLRRSVASVMRWGAGVAAVFTVVYALGARAVVGLLTDDAAVAAEAGRYLWWAAAVPAAGFAAFAWDGVYTGLTRTREMTVSMLAAMALFFVLWRLLAPSMGNNGLWLAFISYLAARGIALTLMYRHPRRRRSDDGTRA